MDSINFEIIQCYSGNSPMNLFKNCKWKKRIKNHKKKLWRNPFDLTCTFRLESTRSARVSFIEATLILIRKLLSFSYRKQKRATWKRSELRNLPGRNWERDIEREREFWTTRKRTVTIQSAFISIQLTFKQWA